MRRAGDLIDEIASYPNLVEAWFRAIRGKRQKEATIVFGNDLDANLAKIGDDLRNGVYRWGGYSQFKIFDPKERTISVASFRDRITQHAIVNVCEPIFDRRQIDQSFACRKGKGQTKALELACRYSRASKYYLKLDARKYFASIDRAILKDLLEGLFKDRALLKAFFDLIDAFTHGASSGVPIGNLTSQFFANHYLTPLDRHIKEKLKIGRYVRYMDDFVLWGDDRAQLKRAEAQIAEFADERLRLTLKPSALNRTEFGLTFLGMKIVDGRARLSGRARVRFRRKFERTMEKFHAGLATERETVARLTGLFAFVSRADSRAFRLRVLQTGNEDDGL